MSAFHMALASTVMGLGVGMTMIGRNWPDRGKHRGRRPRTVEEYVPAHVLVPALARQVFAECHGCHAEVPVTVHPGGARRCDRGHVTITAAEVA